MVKTNSLINRMRKNTWWDESHDRYPHDQTCETNTHSLTSFNDKGASDK